MMQPMHSRIAVSMNCERIEYRPSGRAPTKEFAYVAATLLEPVPTGEKENGTWLIRALLEPVLTGEKENGASLIRALLEPVLTGD